MAGRALACKVGWPACGRPRRLPRSGMSGFGFGRRLAPNAQDGADFSGTRRSNGSRKAVHAISHEDDIGTLSQLCGTGLASL